MFIVVDDLTCDQSDITLPAPLTFSAKVRDDQAANPPATSDIVLELQRNNNLVFVPREGVRVEPDGKRQHCDRAVANVSTPPLTLDATVSGDASGLLAFHVTLVLPDGHTSGCQVRL